MIENHQIAGLPLDGRNFYELSLLLPGSSPAAPGSAGSVRGDLALNVSGAREDANSFLLDGCLQYRPQTHTFGTNPPVDAIQEFEVLTHSYDASFGRSAGGQINVVLKSEPTTSMGLSTDFSQRRSGRSELLRPIGRAGSGVRRNQFGGSVGGPPSRIRPSSLPTTRAGECARVLPGPPQYQRSWSVWGTFPNLAWPREIPLRSTTPRGSVTNVPTAPGRIGPGRALPTPEPRGLSPELRLLSHASRSGRPLRFQVGPLADTVFGPQPAL